MARIDLASMVVRLEAQTAQYNKQLEGAQRQLKKFQGGITSTLKQIGVAFAAVKLAGFVKDAVDAADRMNDLSKQTGVSVESLSALKFAAEQSGSDLESLTTGLKKLARTAVEAADGTGSQADAFRAIGVSVKDANGNLKPTEELLIAIADQFSKYADGAGKAALAQELFGKAGAELIPFLNEGRSGIEALKDEAARLGIVISGDTAKAADDFNDSLSKMKAQATGLITQAIGPLLPKLTEVVGAFTGAAAGAAKFDGAARVLQTGIKIVSSVAVVVANVFRQIGDRIGAVAAALVAFATGDFKGAFAIIEDAQQTFKDNQQNTANALVKIWSDAQEKVEKKWRGGGGRGRTSTPLPEIPLPTKAAVESISEINVKGFERQKSAMADFYESLDEMTKTSAEKQISQFNAIEAALTELRNAGKISADEFNLRYSEALDDVLSEVEVTAKKIGPTIKAELTKAQEFELQFQRNTQDILGDAIYEGFTGKLDDIPAQFQQMVLKLIAQAQAAKLAKWLFGDAGENGLGTGGSGFLGTLGSLASSFFGGGRAKGGGVSPGKMYRVNEDTPNSEYFVPSIAGRIEPANNGGGMTVHQSFVIQAPRGTVSQQTQSQVGAAAARGLSNANRRNN